MKPYFTITTSPELAKAIEKAFNDNISVQARNLELKGITHEKGTVSTYSVVAITTKDGEKMNPEEIFWLGYWARHYDQ